MFIENTFNISIEVLKLYKLLLNIDDLIIIAD